MKMIIQMIRGVVKNRYVNLLISVILIVIGTKELWGDIDSGELNFNQNHLFGIYGIFLFIDALFTIFEGIIGVNEGVKTRNK